MSFIFLANQTQHLRHNVDFVVMHDTSRRIKEEHLNNE